MDIWAHPITRKSLQFVDLQVFDVFFVTYFCDPAGTDLELFIAGHTKPNKSVPMIEFNSGNSTKMPSQ